MSSNDSLVVKFLAENDAECPACNYSLRGCTQACCPECGEELSLALLGESFKVLITGLRYLLWALFARSLLMCVWHIWTIVYFPFVGAVGQFDFRWYLRMGIGLPDEFLTVVLCLVAMRRMKSARSTGTFRSVATVVAWIAVLVSVNVMLSMASWFW